MENSRYYLEKIIILEKQIKDISSNADILYKARSVLPDGLVSSKMDQLEAEMADCLAEFIFLEMEIDSNI